MNEILFLEENLLLGLLIPMKQFILSDFIVLRNYDEVVY